MKKVWIFAGIIIHMNAFSQSESKNVLFLGNSYTAVNNLPQMLTDVAFSTGDTLYCNSNCPGGYTFELHSTNATTLSYIATGNWDFVILQEQSQLPSFPLSQVESDVFPYAQLLDSLINAQNSCVETVFYMTWGRKNGDASNCAVWPPVCTYAGMDSLLNLRYRMMADSNDAIISPVGAVWKYIRNQYPAIELYNPDESHPSVAGTYAAACTFYSTLLRKNPLAITYDAGLGSTEAGQIRNAVKVVVYDSLSNWHIGEYDPLSQFNFLQTAPNEISFNNQSLNANNFQWYFGDGDSSTTFNPIHTYPGNGNYDVTLISEYCGMVDTIIQTVTLVSFGIEPNLFTIEIFPNPSHSHINIHSDIENLHVTVTNIYGQWIDSFTIPTSPLYDVSHLSTGIYYFIMEDNNGFRTVKKVLVE